MTWVQVPIWSLYRRVDRSGRLDLPLLSVYRDHGVVLRKGRDDNYNKPGADLSRYKIVSKGDLVINKMKTWQGSLGVSAFEGIVSPAYFVANRIGDVDDRFMHHLLRSRLLIAEYGARSKGIRPAQWDLPWDEFASIKVRLPSAATQRAIADYLDTETSRIDTLITKKRRMIELLAERVSSIIFDGITGRLTSSGAPTNPSGIEWLGATPDHFGTPWLGAFHTAQLGKMLNASAASGPEQYPYIKNTNVQWDSFDLEDLPSMTFDADDRRRCNLRPGDVLVCEGGEVGRSAVWDQHAQIYFQKALHRVRPLTENVPRFLMYCLWAAANLNVFTVEGNQATIVHLTGEKLRSHRFPWPPLEEQEQIVSLIDAARKRIDQAVTSMERQIELLADRRQALVTSAVTGELAVPVDRG